ncbi:hypothetical protein NC653_037995 [Populus alba x Populus x berolinensis]|uniref:Uncharacterized protein n=1 Tax=Populus alba x Populus x berolinensis TaxID=444605 RepID=A0AAD6PTJ5_9ROSI|nr:hypothetical protein NC653_037995 [Populus alba x Populus x berolinensis]
MLSNHFIPGPIVCVIVISSCNMYSLYVLQNKISFCFLIEGIFSQIHISYKNVISWIQNMKSINYVSYIHASKIFTSKELKCVIGIQKITRWTGT